MLYDNERDALVHQAVGLLIQTARLHHRCIEKQVAGTGLHRSQQKMLMHLSRFGNALSQRQIADTFDISPACVARAVKGLVSEGYIERTDNADDQRRNNITITEKGLRIVNETRRTFDLFDQRTLEDFSEEDIRQLIDLLDRVQDNLRRSESCSE